MLDGFGDGRSSQDAKTRERDAVANTASSTTCGRADAEMLQAAF
jgi:hypothetical protein